MLILLFIFAVKASYQDFGENTTVQLLNPLLIEQKHIGSDSHSWFLLFYKPTCPHCHKVMPIWEELANSTSQNITNIGAINCNENPELVEMFKIKGVPTFILISENGNLHKYKGERNLEGLQQFIEEKWNSTAIDSIENDDFFDIYGNPFYVAVVLFVIILIILIYMGLQNDSNYEQLPQNRENQRNSEMEQFRQVSNEDDL